MRTRVAAPLLSLLAVLALLAMAPRPANAADSVALPPDSALGVIALIADIGYATELDGGYQFDLIRIDGDAITYSLRRIADGEDGAAVARLVLTPSPEAFTPFTRAPPPTDPPTRSASFLFVVHDLSGDPVVAAHLLAAQRSIARHDAGDLYIVVGQRTPEAAADGSTDSSSRRRALRTESGAAGVAWVTALLGTEQHAASLRVQLLFPALVLLLAALATGLARWRRRRPFAFSRRLVATHLLPVAIQVAVYTYWSLYWAGVREHLPVLLAQLLFAFAFDALWSLAVHHRWRASFAPLPVVLSANLFVWFGGADQWLGFVVVMVGLASKSLVRDGRHVFNPSAFGLAFVGVLYLLMPQWFGYDDIAQQLALPPSMIEVIVLAVLIAQLRVPIVLVSISAALMLGGLQPITGWQLLSPYYPAVLIIILALATDPSTIPRTGGGRVLYGLFLGAGIHFAGILLTMAVGMDYWAKVLPIPIVNALVPQFDRWARALPKAVNDHLTAHRNPAHMAAWAAVVLWGLYVVDVKPGVFSPEVHRNYATGYVTEASEDREQLCAAHRPFCEPFRFDLELKLWLD